MAILTATRGDTWERSTTVYTANGGIFNLTGCTVKFTIKRNRTDSGDGVITPRPSWTDGGAADGITVPTPAAGLVIVKLTPAQTGVLTNVGYVYDLQVEDGDDTYTVDSGSFGVALDVTVP